MRGPDQGLGLIPVSKKWVSGIEPRVHKIMLWDCPVRLLDVVIPEQHLLVLGLHLRT